MCEVQKMPLDGCAVDQTQKAEKYIGIYIDNLVGKFRCYNNDEFVVTFVFPIIMLAVLVPFWGLDGVWILNFAAGILSASAAIIIVKKALKNIENDDLKLVAK